jgi:hypothetical protein
VFGKSLMALAICLAPPVAAWGSERSDWPEHAFETLRLPGGDAPVPKAR